MVGSFSEIHQHSNGRISPRRCLTRLGNLIKMFKLRFFKLEGLPPPIQNYNTFNLDSLSQLRNKRIINVSFLLDHIHMTLKSLNSVMPQVNLLMFSPLLLWLCNPPPAENRARPAEKQSLFHFFNFQSETDLPSGHWDSFNRGDLCWEVGQHLQMVVIYVELWSLLRQELRKCSTFDSEKHNSLQAF